ncbi:MAG: zinc ABC transporter substrate-binding protein [Deinococcota bacterium]|nr:zinc ABC transporter substrate-binding protein [Deinococcota bacterium]
MKKLLAGVVLTLSLTAFAQNDALKVVATYSIVGDFVQNVGGDAIDLSVLVGPDTDAHTFEPTPSEVVTLGEAEVIFENGLEFEPWLDRLYTSSGSTATRVVVTDGIGLLTTEDDHESEEEEHDGEEDHEAEEGPGHQAEGAEHGDEHGEFDPHVWHDVRNAVLMVENIRDALIQADPSNADRYTANAEAYIAQLEALDAFVEERVATLPQDRRRLVTSHDTFAYFADRYGFEVVGTVLPSVTTEVADPSAGELAALIDDIRAAGVPAIFAENVSNLGLLERVASGAGVSVAPPLYTDALGTPGSEGASYIDMMRYNVTTIVEVLND